MITGRPSAIMRRKSWSQRVTTAAHVRKINQATSIVRRKVTASFWKVYAVNTQSSSCVDTKGVAKSLYCEWSQEFLETSRKRLVGDTERKAMSRTRKKLRQEIGDHKKALAEILLENGIPKKMNAFARKSSRRAVVSGRCNTPAALQSFS